MPNPESSVHKATPALSIQGRVDQGSATLYVEQSATPEGRTADDGSFAFTFDAARLEALRLQYGLQSRTLRLYFISETMEALNESVNLDYRGDMDLGTITMQPATPVTGRILNAGTPVENARVRLGRKEFLTAADGTFTASIPAATPTPLLVEKKGFVQTKGTWQPGAAIRDVELYTDLAPYGTIEVLPLDRTLVDNKSVSVNYSATSTARYIRFSYVANDFSKTVWLDLNKSLRLAPPAANVIYFQFADQDQKVVSPVLNRTLNVTTP
jgi:hypothetical protein